jgi:colanic acid/amylovoran biosynthesis glycosyltransferase
LSIAGSGPLERNLKELVRALGIEARVSFLGAISHAAVAELLSRSDILLAPSAVAADGDRDSGLLSAKEASACECIPIATRHGGIPSIVEDSVTGFLVAEHDVAAIAERVVCLARDTEKRRSMGREARGKMQRQFDLRGSVRQLESHYDEIVRRHTPSDRLSAGTLVPRPSSQ